MKMNRRRNTEINPLTITVEEKTNVSDGKPGTKEWLSVIRKGREGLSAVCDLLALSSPPGAPLALSGHPAKSPTKLIALSTLSSALTLG